MPATYLWNTDFFTWAKDQPDASFDTIIADQPYGSFQSAIGENAIKDASFDTEAFCNEACRLLKPTGIFAGFCSIYLFRDYFFLFNGKLRFRCEQAWDKRPTRTWISNDLPLRHVEYVAYFGEGDLDFRTGESSRPYTRPSFGGPLKETTRNDRRVSKGQFQQILEIPIMHSKQKHKHKAINASNLDSLAAIGNVEGDHPTPKPIEYSLYFKRVILDPGRVLDPCCGRGSLIWAFDNAIGIDIAKWTPVDASESSRTTTRTKQLDAFIEG